MSTVTETIPTFVDIPSTADPTNFDAEADDFLGTQLPAFVASANTLAGQINTVAGEVNANSSAAAASAVLATAAAGAELWVSGQAYVDGEAAISGIDYQAYRANTNTSGTTDPSASVDWTLVTIGAPPPLPIPITTVTATAASAAILNTGIDSTYSAYDLIIIGTASANAALSMRVELTGSVISTSTYVHGYFDQSSAGAAAAWQNANVGSPVSSIPIYTVDNTATSYFYLRVRITNPSSTAFMKHLEIVGQTRLNSGNVSYHNGIAMNTGTGALTGIQIFPASGTITCTMNLYPVNIA